MGYIVISQNETPVNAIGPCDAEQAEYFFGFNNYNPDPSRPGFWQFDSDRSVSGEFKETLPGGIPVSYYVPMM